MSEIKKAPIITEDNIKERIIEKLNSKTAFIKKLDVNLRYDGTEEYKLEITWWPDENEI